MIGSHRIFDGANVGGQMQLHVVFILPLYWKVITYYFISNSPAISLQVFPDGRSVPYLSANFFPRRLAALSSVPVFLTVSNGATWRAAAFMDAASPIARSCSISRRASPSSKLPDPGLRPRRPFLCQIASNCDPLFASNRAPSPALVQASRGDGQVRFLNRQLSLPVSMMSQWWVRRSSMAVVILASPNTWGQSAKARLVVISSEVFS